MHEPTIHAPLQCTHVPQPIPVVVNAVLTLGTKFASCTHTRLSFEEANTYFAERNSSLISTVIVFKSFPYHLYTHDASLLGYKAHALMGETGNGLTQRGGRAACYARQQRTRFGRALLPAAPHGGHYPGPCPDTCLLERSKKLAWVTHFRKRRERYNGRDSEGQRSQSQTFFLFCS